MKTRTAALAASALLLAVGLGLALAQGVVVPKVVAVGPNDLFQDIVNGQPQAGNFYASAGQISGVQLYANETAAVGGTGDPAYHFVNGVVNAFAHATGAITTATLTTEPNPSDGKRECCFVAHSACPAGYDCQSAPLRGNLRSCPIVRG